jgi:uncharacterized protein (DUF885 family)
MEREARRCGLPLLLAALAAGGSLSSCKMARPLIMPSHASKSTAESDPQLAQLSDEYWTGRLRADPIEATLLGDHRWGAELPDPSPGANQREIERLEAIQRRLGTLQKTSWTDVDRVTLAALLGEIESEIAWRRCAIADWAIDPRDGPHVTFQNLAQLTPVVTEADGAALLARWRKMGTYLDARVSNLRMAAQQHRIATRGTVQRVLQQLHDILAAPTREWVLMAPAHADHPDWSPEARRDFSAGVAAAVETVIKPALQRYRDVAAAEILPAARDDDHVGLGSIADGAACYQRMIRVHTSLALSAEQIHHIGLEEIARIRAEMIELGHKLFGTRDLAAIQARLRGDPALYFNTRAEVEAKAREALLRAEAAVPAWFATLPRTPCEVVRVEAYEEKDTTIAYYRQPAVDGSRTGRYYINTYAPETRPRYEAEALAFHESVPGHHTQIALAMEAIGIPEFRKHLGVTAYVEGWALYTERLADEMGLYSADLDRMGMLSFDAWRASRLVVDTGLHAMGWSRHQAIAYMLENTALAANNIENEVDRYIGWPGQALAYKLGQREMFALRALARDRLGARFDIRAFHDQILRHGAVSLAILRGEIERWLDQVDPKEEAAR